MCSYPCHIRYNSNTRGGVSPPGGFSHESSQTVGGEGTYTLLSCGPIVFGDEQGCQDFSNPEEETLRRPRPLTPLVQFAILGPSKGAVTPG